MVFWGALCGLVIAVTTVAVVVTRRSSGPEPVDPPAVANRGAPVVVTPPRNATSAATPAENVVPRIASEPAVDAKATAPTPSARAEMTAPTSGIPVPSEAPFIGSFRDGDALPPVESVIPTVSQRHATTFIQRVGNGSRFRMQPIVTAIPNIECVLACDSIGRMLAAHGRGGAGTAVELRLSELRFPQGTQDGSGAGPRTRWLKHRDDVRDAAFSPDGRTLVTAEGRALAQETPGRVHFWNVATGEKVGESLEFGFPVRRVMFTPDGQRIIATSSNPKLQPSKGPEPFAAAAAVHVVDVTSRQKVGPEFPHCGEADALSLSKDGTVLLVAGALDHQARLWSLSTGKAIGPPLTHEAGIASAALTPDGRLAVTASYDGSLRIREVSSGKEIARPLAVSEFRSAPRVGLVAIDDASRRLATADSAGRVRLWTLPEATPIGPPIDHKPSLTAIAFSPDGKLLLTATMEGVIRLWSTEDGSALGPPLSEGGVCYAARFSPDGRLILASTTNGIQVWRSPSS